MQIKNNSTKNDQTTLIQELHTKKVLSIVGSEVILEKKRKPACAEQTWDIGAENKFGWFTIINPATNLVLVNKSDLLLTTEVPETSEKDSSDDDCSESENSKADEVLTNEPTESSDGDNLSQREARSVSDKDESIAETCETMDPSIIAELVGANNINVRRFRRIHRSNLRATINSGQKKFLFPDPNSELAYSEPNKFAFIEEFAPGKEQRALSVTAFSMYDNQECLPQEYPSGQSLKDYFFVLDDSEPVQDAVFLDLMLSPFWYIFGGLGRSGNDFQR